MSSSVCAPGNSGARQSSPCKQQNLSFISEQYGTELFPSAIYSGFMLDNSPDLNRRIHDECELMTIEQDGDRMRVLAEELELLFEQEDLITEDRKKVYRQTILFPPPLINH
jgi:hypothetical protein